MMIVTRSQYASVVAGTASSAGATISNPDTGSVRKTQPKKHPSYVNKVSEPGVAKKRAKQRRKQAGQPQKENDIQIKLERNQTSTPSTRSKRVLTDIGSYMNHRSSIESSNKTPEKSQSSAVAPHLLHSPPPGEQGPKSVFSSDEEDIEFSPSGRRYSIRERRAIISKPTRWSDEIDFAAMMSKTAQKARAKLIKRMMSESAAGASSLNSSFSSGTTDTDSVASLDLSAYVSDDATITRRTRQIAFGKNTEEYNLFVKMVAKSGRHESEPQTPDKFQKVSRRSFDTQVRIWRRQLHRWSDAFNDLDIKPSPQKRMRHREQAKTPVAIQLESEGKTAVSSANRSLTNMHDEEACDGFSSPKKMKFDGAVGVGQSTGLTNDFNPIIADENSNTLTGPTLRTGHKRKL